MMSKKMISSAIAMSGWASSIRSHSVVPERGAPTMKIGATLWKISSRNAPYLCVPLRQECPLSPRRACIQRSAACKYLSSAVVAGAIPGVQR
jgi:hypothetical protein